MGTSHTTLNDASSNYTSSNYTSSNYTSNSTDFWSNTTTHYINNDTVPMFRSPVPFYGTVLIAAAGMFFFLISVMCCVFCFCRCRPSNRKFEKISMDHNLSDYMTIRANQPIVEDLPHKEYGMIYYTLDFDLKKSHLAVGVKKIKDLPGTIFSKPINPFVKVRLYPDVSTKETRVAKFSRSPIYNETFNFPMPGNKQGRSTVMFSVYDHQLFRRHVKLCQLNIALKNVFLNDVVEDFGVLEAPITSEEETATGEVCISLRYIPNLQTLNVIVIEAKNLRTMENSYRDPYVKVCLLVEGKEVRRKKTKTRAISDVNPYFNESFNFKIDPVKILQTSMILRVAFKKSTLSLSKNIGETHLSATSLGTGFKHWLDITSKPGYSLAMWHSLMPCEN